MTGLSASTLEIVILALVVTYPVLAFVQRKLGTGMAGKVLGLLLKAIPFVEVQLRKERDQAKAKALAEAEAKDEPPAP